MSHYAILLGGHLHPTERLRRQIGDARFIAADSGIIHAATLGVTPELWVGDFDSAAPEKFRAFSGVPRQSHPADKAQTDGELAIVEALQRGANRLTLVAAFGGHFDHVLSHGLQAVALKQKGILCLMTSGGEEAHPLTDTVQLAGLEKGSRLSIAGFTALSDLSISGVRWPLDKVEVPFGSTWTISNESVDVVTVSLRQGCGLVVAYPGGTSQ